MDGENKGSKAYEEMDDLGFSQFFGNTHLEDHPRTCLDTWFVKGVTSAIFN